MDTYNWWGSSSNEPPPHLKTKRQLGEMGLRPLKAVGIIHCREFDCLLYNPEDPTSAVPKRKASPKQLEVLTRSREKQKRKRDYEWWRKEDKFIERDRFRLSNG